MRALVFQGGYHPCKSTFRKFSITKNKSGFLQCKNQHKRSTLIYFNSIISIPFFQQSQVQPFFFQIQSQKECANFLKNTSKIKCMCYLSRWTCQSNTGWFMIGSYDSILDCLGFEAWLCFKMYKKNLAIMICILTVYLIHDFSRNSIIILVCNTAQEHSIIKFQSPCSLSTLIYLIPKAKSIPEH